MRSLLPLYMGLFGGDSSVAKEKFCRLAEAPIATAVEMTYTVKYCMKTQV
ncbi:hypothetical protein [Marinobacterium aestuariivivens]|uniref:Uncharacterized protein n=1 Tax=Marinobacterium aestuariivivens TaxID=1698799 RepID=A0ABW1ZYC4_9GAMM